MWKLYAWKESALVTTGAALVILLLDWMSFKTFFTAEAFVYVGSYRMAGDSFFHAVFSRQSEGFFRPTLWALNLPWNLLLPPDPFLYHLRNFLFVLLNLFLFHRLLLRMVRSREARIAAVAFLAVSKVHFTTIGCVATFSTILLLLLTLASMLSLLRFIETHRPMDGGLTGLFTLLCVFSKDYGFVVFAVLGAILIWKRRDFARPGRIALVFGIASGAVIVTYLALRILIVGALPSEGVYRPRVDPSIAVRKTATALSTIGNLSLDEGRGVSGARGLSSLIVPSSNIVGSWVSEVILMVALVTLIALTVRRAGRPGSILLVPGTWSLAFLGPTYLTVNQQMYYYNDMVAGVALAIGILLDRVDRPWKNAWYATIALVGLNGAISGVRSDYLWQQLAGINAPLQQVVAANAASDLRKVVFVTREQRAVSFAIGNSTSAPMVPELFGNPALEIEVVTPDRIGSDFIVDPQVLVLDADHGMKRIE